MVDLAWFVLRSVVLFGLASGLGWIFKENLRFRANLWLYCSIAAIVLAATNSLLNGEDTSGLRVLIQESTPSDSIPEITNASDGQSSFRLSSWAFPWLLALPSFIWFGLRMKLTWDLASSSEQITDEKRVTQTHDICDALGVTQLPHVLLSDAIASPATVGIFRPVILIPFQSSKTWSDAEWAVALTHEIAHIKNRDGLRLTLMAVAVALHWWNPMSWVAARQNRLTTEQAADKSTLTHLEIEAREYFEVVYGASLRSNAQSNYDRPSTLAVQRAKFGLGGKDVRSRLPSALMPVLLFPMIPKLESEPMVFYSTGFESETAAEWSKNRIATSPSGLRYLGSFGNESVTLNLTSLPRHSELQISFDLFLIGSWDGYNTISGEGPDVWSMATERGRILISTTFSNAPTSPPSSLQSFPGTYHEGEYPAGTGATLKGSLGFEKGPHHFGDSVYRITKKFAHSGSALKLTFWATGLEPIGESWGIDNVRLTLGD